MRLASIAGSLSLVALLLAACGGNDDDANGVRPPSTGGTADGPELISEGPPSRYIPFVEELRGNFDVPPPEVFGIAPATWGLTGPFDTPQEGETMADEWGYVGGHNVQFNPDGLLAGVLQGGYYITVQVHIFDAVDGAEKAFEAYETRSDSLPGSATVSTPALANESAAYEYTEGTVGSTDTVAVYHRFIFRRGNTVVSVLTYGAQPFMTIDPARDVAVMIDNRILGETGALEPTPIPTTLPATGG